MAEKPILFSAPMVLAILSGVKTQTRRLQKDAPGGDDWHCDRGAVGLRWVTSAGAPSMPVILRWQPGDRLWVRERWSGIHAFHDTNPSERKSFVGDGWPYLREDVWYWADGNPSHGDWERPRPAIHMPRWASRIALEVTDIRVERLQSISEEDARAEGTEPRICGVSADPDNPPKSYRQGFVYVWRDIHGTEGPAAWVSNPWICAVTFRRVTS